MMTGSNERWGLAVGGGGTYRGLRTVSSMDRMTHAASVAAEMELI
jgi:hypothetical protein